MKSKAVVVAVSAMALMGCGSNSGLSGTGAQSGGAPGTGGATMGTGGGSGGGVGPAGTGGSTQTAAGGIPGSGGRTGQAGNTASGGAAGNTGGQGGAKSDAAAFSDTAVDASQCPICTTIRCAYGSPVDENGCTLCVCNPAPDGAIDVTTDGFCALPEGCAGTDVGPGAETGGRDLNSADAIKCGNAICRPGEYCCNPLTDTCVPPGWGCGF